MPTDETLPQPAPRGSDAERLADLAIFADGLVHDIRNPLNVIRTNVYLLRQRLGEQDARTLRAVDRIDDQVTVALRLLEGVSAFYRCDRPTLQQTNLGELVAGVLATAGTTEDYALQAETPDDLPLIAADPQLLDAALRALIRNAVESQPDGGTIIVRAEAAGPGVRVSVEDAGEGVPREARARAFEAFFTTRRSHAGLGLALVRRVAETHGGTVELESHPKGGTRAVMELPLAPPGD